MPASAGFRAGLIALVAVLPLIAAAQQRPAIVPIATVRNMASWTPSKAPVRIRGTVTVRDRLRNLTFVQDGTAGLFVTAQTPLNLAPGQVVEVTGQVVMSRRGPTIAGAVLDIAGNAEPPDPQPIAASAASLASLDARLVSARGVVRRVESRGSGAEITIRTPEGVFTILGPSGSSARAVVDSVVSVQGVLSHALAEDHSLERRVRRLVSTELGRRGFTVIAAEDGRAALEMFTVHKDRVDVIVTDVVMPRMNGADLAKAVEKIQPGVKILFISGHPERSGVGLNPTGVTNLLMKPFTADTLATRIKELIAGKLQGDERG